MRTTKPPPTELTYRWLAWCDALSSQDAAIARIAAARAAGVPNLPPHDKCSEWSAREMRNAVAYLDETIG